MPYMAVCRILRCPFGENLWKVVIDSDCNAIESSIPCLGGNVVQSSCTSYTQIILMYVFVSRSVEKNKIYRYTGLEHRQTLRACTSIVISKLKLKIDNLELGI